MTPEQVANALRLISDLYGQLAATQAALAQAQARIAELEAEKP